MLTRLIRYERPPSPPQRRVVARNGLLESSTDDSEKILTGMITRFDNSFYITPFIYHPKLRKNARKATPPQVPDKQKRLKTECFFSDLTEEQMMPWFCNAAHKFQFVPFKVFLSYKYYDPKVSTRVVGWQQRKCDYTYDLPNGTAHCKVGSPPQLFGSIQAAAFSLDPWSPCFSMFDHKFNDPIVVPQLGTLSPQCITYCSIPFSTSVQIAAKLYVTTDTVDDMRYYYDYDNYYADKDPSQKFNEAFEVCNGSALINLSDNLPNGGSGSCTLHGREGCLNLYYVAFKYAVDAALEVDFFATSEETKVAGRVMAYYGNNFDYGCSPAEKDNYKAMLFETEQHEVKPGKINLMRSVLSVPAQFSLIIDANLTDSTSGAIILSGVYEFFVPTHGGASIGRIEGNDCSLLLKVDWKLPPFAQETTPSKRSYYSDLTKKQVFFGKSVYPPVTMDEKSSLQEEDYYRWNLQEKISRAFSYFLHHTLYCGKGAVSISISSGTQADECDYFCTSILNVWPELRECPGHQGPKSVGLFLAVRICHLPRARMLESIVVGGPGFFKFKLSGTWIAESIRKMLMYGIDIWAPKLPMKKTVIYSLSRNTAKAMCMDHLRSTILGETLARMLAYSRVGVHRRFHYGDRLDVKSKMMMTEFLFDRFPIGEVNYHAIGELEVLYEESKKRFDEDAEFRERTQQVQDLDERHETAWEQICKISRERYQEVYQRLGVVVKEEGEELNNIYINKTKSLLTKQGLTIESEGAETISFEGQNLPLVDLAALWRAFEKEKADRIVHVADVGQRDKIEMCITAAKSAGLIVTNNADDRLSHVGFGLVQGKDLEGFRTNSKVVNLVNLLDEAKSRCKAVLVEQGKAEELSIYRGKPLPKKKADELLEHNAEALGYGAVKYADLKNDRLTNYTFSFDDMLNEKGNTALYLQYTHARIWRAMQTSSKQIEELEEETLSLKDGEERELGLLLLQFTEVLGEACRVFAPHILCEYVYELCKKFNKLYSSGWQVVQSGEDSKILLCEATKVVIRKCFHLLGITPIYRI